MRGQSILALDGSKVSVELISDPGPVTGSAHVDGRLVGLSTYYVTSGPVKMGEELALDPNTALGMQFVEEYAYEGGLLRLGQGEQLPSPDGGEYAEIGPDGRVRESRVNVGIWEGQFHCLFCFRYSGEPSAILSLFEILNIADEPAGIGISPKDRRRVSFIEGPSVVIDIPGSGILDIRQRTRALDRMLPSHAGAPVRGGEVFVGRAGTTEEFYLLVGRSAITHVIPYGDLDVCEANLGEMVITWEV